MRRCWVPGAGCRVLVLGALLPALSAPVLTVPLRAQASIDPAAAPEVMLLEARRTVEALDYERAVGVLDRVVAALEPKPQRSPTERQQLIEAYELRARARFYLNDRDGARDDFKSLLTSDPGHELTGQISPNVVALFADLKKSMVGTLNLNVTPTTATVQIDGVPATAPGEPIAVVAGPHTVSARQPGYRAASDSVEVPAGASADLTMTLERVSSTIRVTTTPQDVEVLLDGMSRGRSPLVLDDVATGPHTIALKRDCYVPVEQRVDVSRPADYPLPPVQLAKAVGTISLSGGAGMVMLDGQSRGPSPLTIPDVCEGAHLVEVRSTGGRYVKRLDIRSGDAVPIRAELRPAIAVLTVSGVSDAVGQRFDPRIELERALQNARTVTVFAAPADQVAQALSREKLPSGWLSFDAANRPIGDAASAITPAMRRDASAKLARALDVQAVASVTTLPGAQRSDVLLTILAAGSGSPETLRIKIDDTASIARAVERLDSMPPLLRASAGLLAADILDVQGGVVIAVDPNGPAAKAGIAVGDTIVAADGRPVQDGSAVARLVASKRPDGQITFDVKDRTGGARQAAVKLAAVPQAIAMADETLLFNKLIIDFRQRLLAPASPLEESVARLNLAIALMRVGDWADARTELDAVRLPDGPGVSNGTVQYLSALCRDALGQRADAEAALRAAAATSAQLVADGPAIKGLAEKKLAELARRRP